MNAKPPVQVLQGIISGFGYLERNGGLDLGGWSWLEPVKLNSESALT